MRSERIWKWLAWALPRELVMWCAVRVWAHATYVYPSDECPSMHMDKCLGAWDKGPEFRYKPVNTDSYSVS